VIDLESEHSTELIRQIWVSGIKSHHVFCLCVLNGGRFRTLAVADLLSGDLASAHAATPAWRCGLRDEWHWLLISAPGSHQFAIAVWTLSLNHKLLHQKMLLHALEN